MRSAQEFAALQPRPEAFASGSVVIGDSAGSWVFDVVGTQEASMRLGAPCKAEQWSEIEADTPADLVDLGGFDPADFEAGPCEAEPGLEAGAETPDLVDFLVT